jgi:hypothetical protein
MSNYYDPWAHAARLFVNRLFLFIVLSLLLGLAVWAGLLHWVFAADLPAIARATWAMVDSTDLMWRLVFWQSAAAGVLLTTVLYTWLLGRARLRRGDRHHRGARVVHADAND